MVSRSRQRGMTLLSFAVVLSLCGFFAYIGMKLFPLYSEFWGVKDSMEQVAATPGIGGMTPDAIWGHLSKRFYISYVESVKKEHMKIDKKTQVTMTVSYEVRRPLVGNLDIVAKFEHSVVLPVR